MKHPKRPIDSVILRCLSSVGKTIGNESCIGIGSESFEKTTRLVISPCAEEQARERNHAIPSPVGKPGIASDDRFEIRGGRLLSAILQGILCVCGASYD